MKDLSDYTPAQTLLLTRGKRVPIKDLMKVTMMDLIIRKVINTIEISKHTEGESTLHDTYIVAGNNFGEVTLLAHEQVFVTPFLKDEDAQIRFSDLIKLAFQNAKSEKQYNKLVRGSEALQNCFATGPIKIVNAFARNRHGDLISARLKSQLRKLSDQLPLMMKNDPEKSVDILKQINGNICLVEGVDFKRLAEIEKTILSEVHSSQTTNSFLSDPITWLALDFNARQFDSSTSGYSAGLWDTDFSDGGYSDGSEID